MPPPANRPRDEIVGPASGPESPFPIKLSGPVIKGFGRGSRELGIPTANIPISGLSVGGNSALASGVYFGWVGLDTSRKHKHAAPAPPDPNDTAHTTRSAAHDAHDVHSNSASTSNDAAQTAPQTKTNPAILSAQQSAPRSASAPPETFPAVLSIGYNPFYKNTVRSVEVHIMHSFSADFYHSWLNLSILGFIRPEYDYSGVDKLIEDIRTDIEVAGRSLGRSEWAKWREDTWLVAFPAEGDESKETENL